MPELALNLRRVAGRICHDDGMLVAADATVMDSLAWLRVMSAVPMGGNAELGAVRYCCPSVSLAVSRFQVPSQACRRVAALMVPPEG